MNKAHTNLQLNMCMYNLAVTDKKFNPNGYWSCKIENHPAPHYDWVKLFDQNGYDLTEIEIMFSKVNGNCHSLHRNATHVALKYPWFIQDPSPTQGAVLNHALLFERKAYQGQALDQLQSWAQHMPLLYKVIRMRPKWGLDFSIDWADTSGNVFEIFHYEFDSFDYTEISELKSQLEEKFLKINWESAAQELLKRKAEWHDLDFFGQSDYKCGFFGLPSERFKMVIWE